MDLYGGGGLVSTVDDLARFFRALLTGQVFSNAATLPTMIAEVHVDSRVSDTYASPLEASFEYGLGIRTTRIDGLTVYHHGGYWGVLAAYVPELDLAVAIAVTEQTSKARSELLPYVIHRVRDAEAARSLTGSMR
jgi:D-alanyl-D-alanine carboxypeptidase